MDTNELRQNQELLQALKRRKHERELQLAKLGVSADPIIKIEIEDLEDEIERLTSYYEEYREKIDDYLVKRVEDLEVKVTQMIKSVKPQRKNKRNFDKSDLKLVDLNFNEDDALDIKLRNIGEQVGFLKAATFRIEQLWNFKPPFVFAYHKHMLIVPSANYSIELEIKKYPYSKYQMLSHSISPNNVDRFTFTFGVRTDGHFPFGFLIEPKLIYNETNRVIDCPRIVILTNGSQKYYSCFDQSAKKEGTVELNAPLKYEVFRIKDIIVLARNNLDEMAISKGTSNHKFQEFIEKVSSLGNFQG